MWYLHFATGNMWLTALSACRPILQVYWNRHLLREVNSLLPLISSQHLLVTFHIFWTWSTRLKRQWMKTIWLKRWSKKTVLSDDWIIFFLWLRFIIKCTDEGHWKWSGPTFWTFRPRNLNKTIVHVLTVKTEVSWYSKQNSFQCIDS